MGERNIKTRTFLKSVSDEKGLSSRAAGQQGGLSDIIEILRKSRCYDCGFKPNPPDISRNRLSW